MRIEGLRCQVPNTLGVRPIAVRRESDDIAVATGSLCNRAGEAGHCECMRAGGGRAEVARLGSREIESEPDVDRPRQIDADLPAINLDACPQTERSMTVPQFEHVRRSRLA
jgi:hypothetical protein